MEALGDMEEYSNISVYNREKYEEIQVRVVIVLTVGEIQLSEEEKRILRRHPKFTIMQDLKENTIKEEMEKTNSIVRMELRDEDSEEKEEEMNRKKDEQQNENEKTAIEKEDAAKTRQAYNPIDNKYDERKRRVTDLADLYQGNTTQPLSITGEAEIE